MNRRPPSPGRRWAAVVLIAAVATGLFFAFRTPSEVGSSDSAPAAAEQAAPDRRDALPVTVVRVQPRSLTRSITINAQVTPAREVAVAPKLSGTVASVEVDVGDRVAEGDVVLRLEDEELRAQFQQATSALELAEANLARMLAGATEEEREQAAAAVRQAASNLEQAQRQLHRMEQLFQDGAISREQLDGARTAYDISKAQHHAAEQQMLRLERGATPEELRAARAQVAQAKAARDLAQLQLDYAVVRAPFSGLVARRSVEPGGLVQAGTPAIVLVDIDKVYVKGSISQAYVNQVIVGETVDVEASFSERPLLGRVYSVSPAADSAGLFPLRIEMDNADHALKPGMFASIRLPIEHAEGALAVPVQAIVRQGDGRAVYVVEPESSSAGGTGPTAGPEESRRGVARLRPVRLGIEEGDWVQVVDGIEEGDWVVVTGHAFLSDGRLVVWTPEE